VETAYQVHVTVTVLREQEDGLNTTVCYAIAITRAICTSAAVRVASSTSELDGGTSQYDLEIFAQCLGVDV
jgi:hypothetical protein